MSFPSFKVHFHNSFGSSPRTVSVVDEETGICRSSVEDCNIPLPESENFQIDNMVKAGVTLNKVNTNILGSGIDGESLAGAFEQVGKIVESNSKKDEK